MFYLNRPFKDGKSFVGTTRYASVAAHKGYELGRKDDLESIIYILIYFMKGILPWQNLQVKDEKERTKLVGNKKENMKLSEICKDLP